MLHKIIKGLAPVAALAMGAFVAGCDGMDIKIGDKDGVPLSELDTSGNPPTKIVLAGPDNVVVSDGDKLNIDVSGDADAVKALRFSLDDGTLGIMREKDSWSDHGRAMVRVTMPSPREIVLAGSGEIEAASLSGDAEVTIAGSGAVKIARVNAGSLDLNIMGSGRFDAAGKADRLDLNVAGSGTSSMRGLKVGSADISMAGSGDAAFSSDGSVEAKIAGSGDVTVYGRATCKVKALGSGTVTCHSSDAGSPPDAPTPPDAPAAPDAPSPNA